MHESGEYLFPQFMPEQAAVKMPDIHDAVMDQIYCTIQYMRVRVVVKQVLIDQDPPRG